MLHIQGLKHASALHCSIYLLYSDDDIYLLADKEKHKYTALMMEKGNTPELKMGPENWYCTASLFKVSCVLKLGAVIYHH